jgi:hypothetical protein
MTRSHILIIIFFIGLFFTSVPWAQEMSVIEVRRNIPLADTDPIYKDFYISTYGDGGLKKNMVVTATRKITIKDATGANSFGEITVPVAQLKIISVQNRIAVAREFKLVSREDEPMIDQIGPMIGDKIDLQGSFIDNKKASAKKTE